MTGPLEFHNPEFNPETGIKAADRKAIAERLSHVLADTYVLFIRTQGVHWNVGGPSFVGIHELTEKQYGNMYLAADKLAERIRALGVLAPAGYTQYMELTAIKDTPLPDDAGQMLRSLIDDHATVVRRMRETIEWAEDKKDFVTSDMLVARMAWHEEALWMLRALSQSN